MRFVGAIVARYSTSTCHRLRGHPAGSAPSSAARNDSPLRHTAIKNSTVLSRLKGRVWRWEFRIRENFAHILARKHRRDEFSHRTVESLPHGSTTIIQHYTPAVRV